MHLNGAVYSRHRPLSMIAAQIAAQTKMAATGNGKAELLLVRLYFDRFDHNELAHRALIQELDASGDLGKESVVLAAANVEPRFYARAALPNNDGAAGHDLPAECFEAKPLRVRIAAVS